MKQEMMGDSGISWTVCKSFAPLHSVFTGRMPFLLPSQQCQSPEEPVDAFGNT